MDNELKVGPLHFTANAQSLMRVYLNEDRLNYLDRDEIIQIIAFLSATLANPEYTAL